MSDFDEQESWSDTEVEIVDLQIPDSSLDRFFLSLGEIPSVIARKYFNRNKHMFSIITLILLITVILPGSSLIADQVMHTQPPKSTYSSSLQFKSCDGFISATPTQVVNEQSSTLSSAPPVSGETFVCGSEIQITVLPRPQNNRNHNP